MAKYTAGKLVRIGTSHYNEGEEIPSELAEKQSNLKQCLEDGTFKKHGDAEEVAPAHEKHAAAHEKPAHPAHKPK
jgi:hypothetical protein